MVENGDSIQSDEAVCAAIDETRAMLAAFGRRIARLRKDRRWDRPELARRLGVSRQRLAHWERGENSPPLDVLLALGRELGVSVDELLTGEAPPALLSREHKQQAQSHLAEVLRLLRVNV
jgi:transcriptional regulator with XRE-family HTH domain